MVRNYKSKGTRKQYSQSKLEEALKRIKEGVPVKKVATDLQIQRNYLIRYVNKTEEDGLRARLTRPNWPTTITNPDQNLNLATPLNVDHEN